MFQCEYNVAKAEGEDLLSSLFIFPKCDSCVELAHHFFFRCCIVMQYLLTPGMRATAIFMVKLFIRLSIIDDGPHHQFCKSISISGVRAGGAVPSINYAYAALPILLLLCKWAVDVSVHALVCISI
jgi:hypothetical protein